MMEHNDDLSLIMVCRRTFLSMHVVGRTYNCYTDAGERENYNRIEGVFLHTVNLVFSRP